jgi:hypothetical protein
VLHDGIFKLLELLAAGQFAMQQQIADLEVGGLLGQLVDGIAR